ncbi:hypothetical protein B0H13DRAFT_1899059 [Mycena leptocephala]|nr:hypothetical protein B0H13DRAFT_1899059 [Mycena leptocephala]
MVRGTMVINCQQVFQTQADGVISGTFGGVGSSLDCPPVDQDVTTFERESSGVGSGLITCFYPAAGACTYFTSDVSSASTTEKASLQIPPTSRASVLAAASATATKRIPPRVIAAICVAVASVVVGLTIALLLCAKHRRRAAKHGATAVDYDANTVSPFTLVTEMDGHNTPPRDSDIRSVSPSTITRQGLGRNYGWCMRRWQISRIGEILNNSGLGDAGSVGSDVDAKELDKGSARRGGAAGNFEGTDQHAGDADASVGGDHKFRVWGGDLE